MNFSQEDFTFSNYLIKPKANLLIKNGKEKRIEAKVMSLLILLVSNKEQVITRQEILTSIWPNVVVGDEGISQLIYSLRNALGDDAKNPQYIETIPKKGYRFIAEVNKVEEPKNVPPQSEISIPSSLKNNGDSLSRKWLFSSGILVIIAMAITWSIMSLFLQSDETNPISGSISPVTQDLGAEGDFSFHKNHNKMVYVNSTSNRVDLYIKKLETNQTKQLTDDLWKEYSPLWLDENTLVYIRKKPKQFQIIRHQLQQKAEVIFESKNYISKLAINSTTPNELTFIEYDYYQHNRLNEVKLLNLTNGEITFLQDSQPDLPNQIFSPAYAQDGKTIYFYANNDERTEIVALNLDNNDYTTITTQFTSVAHISLIQDTFLLVSGQLSTTKGIWRVNLNDHSITNILSSTSGQNIVRAVMNKEQLYYANYMASLNQNIASINTNKVEDLPKLNSNADEYSSVFSKDSNNIYFVSDRTGYHEVWVYDVNKKKAKQVSHIQAKYINRPVLSKNEDYLAVVYKSKELTLAVISVASGELVSKTIIPSMKYILAWSANDESLFISEHKENVNIYQYNRETLQPKLIQKQAGLFAEQSPDRETLTLVDYKFGGAIKLNLLNREITPLNNSIENLHDLLPGQLKVVNQSIMSVKIEGPTRAIYKYPLISNKINNSETNDKIRLMDLPNWAYITDFNVDGTQALFTTRAAPQGDIMKVGLSD
jgi:DNA-binding winged helix-turn-helix (wHTH) protein/Tol biopolymer transport system component